MLLLLLLFVFGGIELIDDLDKWKNYIFEISKSELVDVELFGALIIEEELNEVLLIVGVDVVSEVFLLLKSLLRGGHGWFLCFKYV